jgi:hypothetical protein
LEGIILKRILITSAGGSPATNFVRSLRKAPEKFCLIGVDCNKYSLQRAETDEKYLIPKANEPDYIKILNEIIKETNAEFIHTQNDSEIKYISKFRDQLKINKFIPSKDTISICINKFESQKKWVAAGIKQPKAMSIENTDHLKQAFETLGKRIWIRNVTGAAGRGSLLVDKFDMAKSWIDFHNGWGEFVAAEYLSPQSITWQSIWKEGELIVAQGRKRLYWEFADRAASGITGITGTGVTVDDSRIDEIAKKTIYAIDKKPHGIFSVDLTYDCNGIPNPTEINIARFFTTHYFFTEAGLNMPYIYVKLAYGEDYPKPIRKINPLKSDLAWVRGMDFLPILTDIESIGKYEESLRKRRSK